jgi:cyclic beta-1,2-glucan synthetase
LESVLGINIQGDLLVLSPCIPPHWNDFEVMIKTTDIDYRIAAVRARSAQDVGIEFDGTPVSSRELPLYRDGRPHLIRVSFE